MTKVCVIGAGMSGLPSIRHLKDVAEVTCYDMKKRVGGLWNFEDKTPKEFVDKFGYDYENIYKELDTVIPATLMAFKDFPNNHKDLYKNHHMNNRTYQEYLTSYAEHFDLMKHIVFETIVEKVTKIG